MTKHPDEVKSNPGHPKTVIHLHVWMSPRKAGKNSATPLLCGGEKNITWLIQGVFMNTHKKCLSFGVWLFCFYLWWPQSSSHSAPCVCRSTCCPQLSYDPECRHTPHTARNTSKQRYTLSSQLHGSPQHLVAQWWNINTFPQVILRYLYSKKDILLSYRRNMLCLSLHIYLTAVVTFLCRWLPHRCF